MKNPILILFACTAASVMAHAEDAAKRLITTTGSAVVNVTPDTMTLTFESEVRDADLNKAIQTQAAKTTALLAALRAEKVDELNSSRLSLSPVYERINDSWRETAKISYYTVSQTITCKTKQVVRVPEITIAAIKAGASGMQSPVPSTTELPKHRDTARTNALLAARTKAQAMATALGATIGKVQTIQESPNYGYGNMSNCISNAPEIRGESGESYEPGTIPVSANVTVAFELQ